MKATPLTPLAPRAAPRSKPVARLVHDPERTRALILEAAKAEFAAQADANKRMLYYYFGNKDDLLLAVLEDAYAHIREA